ncbi:chemotaxis protein CheC [Oikeobacillus pervagus]|uniref:Chemotaxis protein CheC n=1 Tax=Oikeobacillus pervagus TaxID=1325931 RepID=A0AAJ1SX80_9BACI|nr:chemotaxis protein CheC [Oikeobacillus pervagus]MDQ0214279.1 chemotaxis protein CheC [Oikeobacillus pervagus]
MSFYKNIKTIHLDILKEIGNIGAGHAATALSSLLNRKIDMKVPDVRVASFDEMIDLAGGAEYVAVSVFLRIDGDAKGSMFFVLPLEQATYFVQKITGDDAFSFTTPPCSELGLSAMQEVGNILSGSYLSALSDFTGLNLYPSVPELSVDMVGAMISFGLIEISQLSDFVIVIDTALKEMDVSANEAIKGHFFLLPDPEAFQIIFRSLGVPLNE